MPFDDDLSLTMIPIVALVAIVAVQLALTRLGLRSPWFSLFIAALVGIIIALGATSIILWRSPAGNLIASLIVNAGTTAALAFGYFNFVNLNYTSLRIRMLREFLDSDSGLSIDDLKGRYSAERVLQLRLDRLVRAGEVVRHGERYCLGDSRKFLRIAQVLFAIRRILGMSSGLRGERPR